MNKEEWRQYWQAKGFPWRTEPEIDAKRQEELSMCRAVVPDIEKGIYPFNGMKLSRADVEWLLATHDAGRGPVDWARKQDRERAGLDLRGADLRQVDLQQLPLTKLRGGLTLNEYPNATGEQRKMAMVLMDRANLNKAQLEGARLREAQLEGAHIMEAQLERADLSGARLEEANLYGSQLEGASLIGTQLKRANLNRARLSGAQIMEAQLEGASLIEAQLEGAYLTAARLEGTDLYGSQLEGAHLRGARLEGAHLREVQLEGADLSGARLEGANLTDAKLGDKRHIGPRLADVQWGDANLAVVDWSQVTKIGDEWEAEQKKGSDGRKKRKSRRLDEYQAAVRGNRQLAVALQEQGLNEDAARFAYRAQVLQRKVFWKQRELGNWLFSLFLALLTGYGYRMWRILVAYLIIILTFSFAYWGVGVQHSGDISFWQALIVSVTAFHGRVFTNPFTPNVPDAQIAITAIEAVVGLIIEGLFIAMLVQRFFGK
jgi:uncharacterized protein YjbI with pentapeptide repeats